MSNVFLQVTSYALNAVWQVAFFWAAGWGLTRCVKRAGLELQHGIWVATLILATIAPATPIIQSYLGYEPLTGALHAPGPAMVALESGRDAGSPNFAIAFPPSVIYLVSGLYIIALLFFSVRLGRMIRRTIALVRNAGPAATEPELAALWRRSQEAFFVQAALLRSPAVPGPVAAGFRRPVLLLPDAFIENHSQAEFLAAVGHECAHIHRNDFWKNIFYEAVSLFTAFHPLTWVIKSQIAQTREMICDEMAADRLLNRRSYAVSLLELASKMSLTATSASHALGMFDTNALERRIMTLTTSHQGLGGLRRRVSRLMAILFLSLCAAASWSLAQSVGAQTSDFAQALGQRLGRQDLTCTYYDENTKGFPGTCWLDENEKMLYRCYLNENPKRSNPQTGCEWKVQRALNSQK